MAKLNPFKRRTRPLSAVLKAAANRTRRPIDSAQHLRRCDQCGGFLTLGGHCNKCH